MNLLFGGNRLRDHILMQLVKFGLRLQMCLHLLSRERSFTWLSPAALRLKAMEEGTNLLGDDQKGGATRMEVRNGDPENRMHRARKRSFLSSDGYKLRSQKKRLWRIRRLAPMTLKIGRAHSDSILRALHGLRNPKGKTAEKVRAEGFYKENLRQNFVKRSPIPPQSIPRSKFLELDNGATPSATRRSGTEELDLVREEEMKLPELKELAKSRGIKGYSKFRIYFFRFMQS